MASSEAIDESADQRFTFGSLLGDDIDRDLAEPTTHGLLPQSGWSFGGAPQGDQSQSIAPPDILFDRVPGERLDGAGLAPEYVVSLQLRVDRRVSEALPRVDQR